MDYNNESLIALIVTYMNKYLAQLARKFEPYVHPPTRRSVLHPQRPEGDYGIHAPDSDGGPASHKTISERVRYLLENDNYMHSKPGLVSKGPFFFLIVHSLFRRKEDYNNPLIFEAIGDLLYFTDGSLASIMALIFQRFPGLAGHSVTPLQCNLPPNFLYLAGCMVRAFFSNGLWL